jgi:hypothetical protein
MRIVRSTRLCAAAECPAIYDTDDPTVVAVQGSILVESSALHDIGDVPARETVVVVPRALLEEYARNQGEGKAAEPPSRRNV